MRRNSFFVGSIVLMYGITAVFLLFLAFVLWKFDLSSAAAAVGIFITQLVSTMAGGFLLGKRKKKNRYLWGLFAGVSYFMGLFLCSILYKKGMGMEEAYDLIRLMGTFALCAISGMIGGMIS